MTEPFKAHLYTQASHRLTDPQNFVVLRQLLLEVGFISPSGSSGLDDIDPDSFYDNFVVSPEVLFFDDVGVGNQAEAQLSAFVLKYSARFPRFLFRFERVSHRGHITEIIQNGEAITSHRVAL